jgi:hypothetical protein
VTGYLWAFVCFLGVLALTALAEMVSEEVRDRLNHLPHSILRLAARRLDSARRVTVYEREWLPKLTYILEGDEARPVTRLVHGVGYALGILASTRRITRTLGRAQPSGATQKQQAEWRGRPPAPLRALSWREKWVAWQAQGRQLFDKIYAQADPVDFDGRPIKDLRASRLPRGGWELDPGRRRRVRLTLARASASASVCPRGEERVEGVRHCAFRQKILIFASGRFEAWQAMTDIYIFTKAIY